jgi:hypothetical protein
MKALTKFALAALVVVGSIGLTARGVPAETSPALDARTQEAIVAALDDERKAQATYQAVIDRYGEVMPFVNIIRAEVRHERNLLPLFEKYGVPVPANKWATESLKAPDTLQAAYEQGIAFEKANAEMYSRFLAFVKEDDIRSAFDYNRGASVDNHLRALERFAAGGGPGRGRGNGPGMGQGPGMGRGNGQGMGRGGCCATAPGTRCKN